MKKAVLVVSFGTAYKETREKTIEAIEADIAGAFPDRCFYRAWTSGFLRKKVLQTEGMRIDSPEEALNKMQREGISDVVIAPTQFADGREIRLIRETAASYADRPMRISFGRPLLSTSEDIALLAEKLEEIFSDVPKTEMLIFMGHGSDEIRTNPYVLLNEQFKKDGYEHFAVGTVEYDPGFEPLLETARKRRPEKILLSPLMVVAGEHALHDMSGREDSWASRLKKAGFETDCILKGMGEYPQIREIYVSHAKEACHL